MDSDIKSAFNLKQKNKNSPDNQYFILFDVVVKYIFNITGEF
jgi:hypothetical protein